MKINKPVFKEGDIITYGNDRRFKWIVFDDDRFEEFGYGTKVLIREDGWLAKCPWLIDWKVVKYANS